MPIGVALQQQALLAFRRPQAAVLPDVGEHDDPGAGADMARGEAALQQTEAAAEGDLRRLGKMLAGERQDGVGMPRGFDSGEGLVVQPKPAARRERRRREWRRSA